MSQDSVFVGVPAFRASRFIAKTVASVLDQSHRDLQIMLSIDGDDTETADACKPYLIDPRVTLVVQPRRLGWVNNTRYLLSRAIQSGASFACIQPHDDLLHDDYLSHLLHAARENPMAAVVYADLAWFGSARGVVVQPSTTAVSPLERMRDLLSSHFDAVAFRGLTRVSALRRVPPINENACDNFAVDTVWMTRLAGVGTLVRVPRTLYLKRKHADNTHSGWYSWPIGQQLEAWQVHCLDMLKEAAEVVETSAERTEMLKLAATRLLAEGPRLSPYHEAIGSLSPERRRNYLHGFLQKASAIL